MWHWQQYVTFILALFVMAGYLVGVAAYEQPKKRVECAFSIISLALFQWILYSGGWYGQ